MRITSTRTAVVLAALTWAPLTLAQDDPSRFGSFTAPISAFTDSFSMQPGDLAVLNGVAPLDTPYIATPGVREFSGQMIVRPIGQTGKHSAIPAEKLARAKSRVAPLMTDQSTMVEEYVITLPEGVTENEAAAFLLATGEYEVVEPNWTLAHAGNVPNDPQYFSSWQHTRLQSADAWEIFTGSSDIIVAVCDSGCDPDHPDLEDAYVTGFNATTRLSQLEGGQTNDLNGHGTFVAGCAAAIGNNSTGVVGVGWNFKVMPIRVSELSSGNASAFRLYEGARIAAANGAHVVNVSYSGGSSGGIRAVGRDVKADGGLLFWASGNDGVEIGIREHPEYVVVGSTRSTDSRSGFSNYGPVLSITAPGSGVRSTTNGGGYSNSSGTSFASPIAAGVGAMIYAVRPELHPTDIQAILYQSADDLGAAGRDDFFGYGRVNTFNAVQLAQAWIARFELPASDSFDSGTLNDELWPNATVGLEPEGDGFALVLVGDDAIASSNFIAESFTGDQLTFSASVRPEGAEQGETLTFEYLDAQGDWQLLARVTATGFDTPPVTVDNTIPEDDAVNGLAIRITAAGDDASDRWIIDDVRLDEIEPIALPFADDFELAAVRGTNWAESDLADVSGGALRLDPAGSVTTRTLDAGAVFPQSLFFVGEFGATAAAGDILVEYRDIFGNFVPFTTLAAADLNSEPQRVELVFSPLAMHLSLAVRISSTMPSGEAIVDNIEITTNPAQACAPDLAPPEGILDFNDVVAFLSAFGAGEPEADFAEPFGEFNFNDVIGFLGAFSAGCP